MYNILKHKFTGYEETIADLKDQFKYIPGNEKALEAGEDFKLQLQQLS